jgi:hypothetical protein
MYQGASFHPVGLLQESSDFFPRSTFEVEGNQLESSYKTLVGLQVWFAAMLLIQMLVNHEGKWCYSFANKSSK